MRRGARGCGTRRSFWGRGAVSCEGSGGLGMIVGGKSGRDGVVGDGL